MREGERVGSDPLTPEIASPDSWEPFPEPLVGVGMLSGSTGQALSGVASLHGPLDLDNIGILWGARKIRESWLRGLTASIACDTVFLMNYRIPPEVALRVKDKLDEYLKLIARLEELEKDPDLSLFKRVVSKPNHNPSKPAMKYVEEVFASLPSQTLLDTYELIDKMKQIGYWSSAEKVYLTVYGILRRESKKADTHLVKVGSKWKWETKK